MKLYQELLAKEPLTEEEQAMLDEYEQSQEDMYQRIADEYAGQSEEQ